MASSTYPDRFLRALAIPRQALGMDRRAPMARSISRAYLGPKQRGATFPISLRARQSVANPPADLPGAVLDESAAEFTDLPGLPSLPGSANPQPTAGDSQYMFDPTGAHSQLPLTWRRPTVRETSS